MYDSVKYLHALIGTVALVSFWWAGFSRKGSVSHRFSGRTYLIAMCGIIVSGGIMAVLAYSIGKWIIATFLVYLLLITATAMWNAWRAIRDKQNYAAYTGPVFKGFMVANAIAGLTVLALGITEQNILFAGFSLVGLKAAWDSWRDLKSGPKHTLWWREAHMDAMLGNAIATHIAFLLIGLPKILPMLAGPVQQNLAWFGPIAVALIVRRFLVKRFPKGKPLPAPGAATAKADPVMTA